MANGQASDKIPHDEVFISFEDFKLLADLIAFLHLVVHILHRSCRLLVALL